jgi:hypothetical protein
LISNENCLGGDAMLEVSSNTWDETSWSAAVCAPRFCLSIFALTLVSSKGRHLKSFL